MFRISGTKTGQEQLGHGNGMIFNRILIENQDLLTGAAFWDAQAHGGTLYQNFPFKVLIFIY